MSDTNPEFIPNLDQYCNRWCDRCPFCHRCQFLSTWRRTTGRGDRSRPTTRGSLFAEIEQISAILFRVTHRVTAWNDRNTTVAAARMHREPGLPLQHPLYLRADAYACRARTFIRNFERTLRQEAEFLTDRTRTRFDDAGAFEDYLLVSEATLVIAWHYPLVPIKILRALCASAEAGFVQGEKEAQLLRQDADGSAKVAYLAVEESVAALKCIRSVRPVLGIHVNRVLRDAKRLLTDLDHAFPGHWTFMRPGFDEPVYTE